MENFKHMKTVSENPGLVYSLRENMGALSLSSSSFLW